MKSIISADTGLPSKSGSSLASGKAASKAQADLLKQKLEKFPYRDFSSGLPFSVVRCLRQRPREAHTHDFHEIVVITNGVGIHVTKFESWPVQAGDVLVIGGNQAHYYDDVQDLSLVNILYQSDAVGLDIHDIASVSGFPVLFGMPHLRSRHEFRSRFHLKPKDLSTVLTYVDGLEHELAHDHAGREYFAHAYFRLTVGLLSRLYSQERNLDSSAIVRLAEVIAHMERHFAESHSMAFLAQVAGMTERSLLRTFHLATGTSPHDYLLQLRINRAADELRNSGKQITEIAFDVGFNDSNYFTRQFKKRMGMTPQEYRHMVPSST